MSCSAEITVLLIAFLNITVVSGKELTTADDFHIAECIWDGRKCVKVNGLNPETEELDDNISEWPPGPYALPMPIDGCPEPRKKGWRPGYIDFTWKEPRNVYSSDEHISDKTVDSSILTNLKDITNTQLPDVQSSLIGPYSSYRVKLNFCFKIKRNVALDRGSWFAGNYTIYGDTSGCPTGFIGELVDIQLAKVKHWISDGQLPYFSVNSTHHEIDLLQILQCSRKNDESHAAKLFLPENPFIFLQYQCVNSSLQNDRRYFPCTHVANMKLTEEVLYLFPTNFDGNWSDINTLSVYMAFCYYFPTKWINGTDNLHVRRIPKLKGSYVVRVMDVVKGHSSVNKLVPSDWSKQKIFETSIINLLPERFSHSAQVLWKVLDLGRSMTVVALSVDYVMVTSRFRGYTDQNRYLTCPYCSTCQHWKDVKSYLHLSDKDFPDDSVEEAGNSCRDPYKLGKLYCMTEYDIHQCHGFRWREKIGTFPRCLISAGKWNFLHFSALSCKYEVYYEADPTYERFYLIFYRSVEGRYISLVGGEQLYSEKHILTKDTHIDVLTNRDIFRSDEDDTCNMNLGMSDDTIMDHQIFASSSRPNFPPTSARPFLSSWCASTLDSHPYIMIDLVDLIKVESLEIWNWEDMFQTIDNGSVVSRFLRMGARSISVRFSNTTDIHSTSEDKVFLLDALYQVDEPQTFVLHTPVYARFVRIQILESLTQNLSCLRIELHGCRTMERSAFPTLAYETVHLRNYQTNASVLSFMSVVSKDAILTSIGYPAGYRGGESYKWVIEFGESEFIKLVFTNVSLNINQHQQGTDLCDDTILFNEELYLYEKVTAGGHDDIMRQQRNVAKLKSNFHIDSSYNGRTFMIEIKRSFMTLSFTTCQRFGRQLFRGQGFRALALKLDIPACFSLDNFKQVRNANIEKCEMSTMTLSSLSYFNIDFLGTIEKWMIRQNKGYLRFEFLHFNVKCDTGSTFVLADRFSGEKKFCNLKRAPRISYTSSCSVNVTFVKFSAESKESFRLLFHTVLDQVPETITTKAANIPEIYSSVQREAYETNSLRDYEVDDYHEVNQGTVHNVPRLLYKVCSRRFDKCYSVFSVSDTWISSGKECWIRQQRLVSIRSLDEMKLVKYTLRNFKFLDIDSKFFRTAFSHDIADYYYYAYIGLRRGSNERQFQYWEDTTPVTFSAWKPGEPLKGDCVRMGFYKANDDSTWEAVDCDNTASFYFICEYNIGSHSIDELRAGFAIQDRVLSEDYAGNHSVTIGGFTCQRWDSQFPHQHRINKDYFFPDKSVSDAANYCRDVRAVGSVWCYTTNPEVKQDWCFPNELLEEISPQTYNGRLSVSKDGYECSKWPNGFIFLNETIADVSNYCRLPLTVSSNSKPFTNLWCFNHNSKEQICYFPDTASDRCENTHYKDGRRDTLEEDNAVSNETQSSKNFTCRNGQLIYSYAYCNGLVECDDASDEDRCTYTVNKFIDTSTVLEYNSDIDENLLFLCNTNEWISFLAYCDGVVDCYDASDETNCSQKAKGKFLSIEESTAYICGVEQFQCLDGSCIHLSLVCNFLSDCIDSSDEICENMLCSGEEFACANGKCIATTKRCDYVPDCLDHSDETNCESCSSNEVFHCDYVRCLPRRLLCDGYRDCEDGSDEMSCDWSDLRTCQDWWEIGYRKSGMYTVQYRFGGAQEVECDFSDVIQNQKIYTIFHNVDIMEWEGVNIITSNTFEGLPSEGALEMYFDRQFMNTNIECTHEIVQSCMPALDSARKVEDPSQNQTNEDCDCIASSVKIDDVPNIVSARYCDNNESLSDKEMDKIYFNYSYASYRSVPWKNLNKSFDHMQLSVGPVTCKEDFKPDLHIVGCNEGRKVFPESVRCMYDVDRAQNIFGCRSGSHLQECESYKCRPGTMKCANSFCIPLRFVCDGKIQCPNGEDEKHCSCDDNEREIVILQEDAEYRGPDVIAMAKQLGNANSIIRHLLYVSDSTQDDLPFQHRLLRIRDKEIKPYALTDREYECKYNVSANDVLDVLKFSKSSQSAVIFIQSSPESRLVAESMFGNISKAPGIFVYRTWEQAVVPYQEKEYKFVTNVRVNNWNRLTSLTARYFPNICKEYQSSMFCPNAYKCASSKMCITLDQVCDGHADCIHGDDETLCNFVCPVGCRCDGFVVTCNSFYFNGSIIPVEHYPKLSRSLTIRNSVVDKKLSIDSVLDFPFLYLLNISRCGLERIPPNIFILTKNIRILDISYNLFTHLSSVMFKGLKRVQILNLEGNRFISKIESYTFGPLQSIRKLRITKTKVRKIVSNTFADLTLDYLEVSNNYFEEIDEFGFGNLHAKHIDFESNVIMNYEKGIFTGLSSVVSLRTPAFKFCCIRPNYVPEEKCFPQKDEFSSCEDLMRISALQTMLWLIGLCALLGNILSVIYRLAFDRERLKLGYGVFVTNLAVADFLMGIYLIIIAIADAIFRKRYIFIDDYWRNSYWCIFAGVLSTLSSEASVMFLCFITLDRLIVIKYPFGQFRFDTKKALICSASAWFIALSIALFPILHTAYFKNGFYSKSGVCIALPLTKDRPSGWLYSVLIFIFFNFIAFLLIALGQWLIYMNIKKSRVAGASRNRKRDLNVSRNLLLVVATDFLCWFPIGCIGMMAMSGRVISGDVYAWAAVFILPVNSALNPILYTLPAILGKKSLTPRTGEQSTKPIKTGIGKKCLTFKNIFIQRFFIREALNEGSFVCLSDFLPQEELIDPVNMLRICLQLSEILCVLHHKSLVLKPLNADTVYIRSRGDQMARHVQVHQEPKLCTKLGEKHDDIYQMGLLLNSLICKYRKD